VDRIRELVKQIPGSVYTVRQLRKCLPQFGGHHLQDGEWLYQREVIEWLCNNRSARKQLPLLYRIFGAYCAHRHRSGGARITGGREIHRSIISLRKALRLKDNAPVNIDSKTIFLDLHDPRMLQVPNEISDSYPDTAILRSFIGSQDTFVDVGANHGSFSVAASKVIGSEGLIVAIEPQPRKADLVKKSLAANAECEFQVHNIACADETSEADFFIPTGSSGGASMFSEYAAVVPHQKIRVSVRRFDEATAWKSFPGQVFVKVDVEGSESKFLNGASEMIRNRRPEIMLEVNQLSMTAAGESKENLIGQLKALGYSRYYDVRPFSGPFALANLLTTARRDVRNIIVTARDALLTIPLFMVHAKAVLDLL